MNLKIITSTTRPERKGIAVANWVYSIAKLEKAFVTELLDLATINLPLMDEPNHPRLGKYERQHTKDWSAKIDSADAFIIVLGEYNYGFPAPIKNAIDFLFREWMYKPVGIVSYGGISGGMRSTQMLKQVVTTLQMMPINTAVAIPFFQKQINAAHEFVANEDQSKAAAAMFAELQKWATSMKDLRSR